jgi:hypothetical protein
VTDDDGLSTQKAFDSIVVSSLTGAVYGGGVVSSPAGAYIADPSLAGTAVINVAVAHSNGAAAPSRVTGFAFRPAEPHFSASSYRWLVVSGGTAWYLGSGTVTINGQSESAEFLVAAVDGPDFHNRYGAHAHLDRCGRRVRQPSRCANERGGYAQPHQRASQHFRALIQQTGGSRGGRQSDAREFVLSPDNRQSFPDCPS